MGRYLEIVITLTIASYSFGCRTGGLELNNQRLVGIWHEVKKGETLESVSRKYQIAQSEIVELNDLSHGRTLNGRKEIFIPKANGKRPGEWSHLYRETGGGNTRERTEKEQIIDSDKKKCGKGATECLAWPVDGEVVTSFGKSRQRVHDGIDISATTGTEIKAAEDGTVLYSGDDIEGYGNLVIVRHENEIISVYAHNKRNLVQEGDTIKRSQCIAEVGSTGNAEKPHLHFEVRIRENPVNPVLYLETKQ